MNGRVAVLTTFDSQKDAGRPMDIGKIRRLLEVGSGDKEVIGDYQGDVKTFYKGILNKLNWDEAEFYEDSKNAGSHLTLGFPSWSNPQLQPKILERYAYDWQNQKLYLVSYYKRQQYGRKWPKVWCIELMSVAKATHLWDHDPRDKNADHLRLAWERLPKTERRNELSKLAPWAKKSIENKLLAKRRYMSAKHDHPVDQGLQEDLGLYTFVDFTQTPRSN
jgi:hypothetical protein